MDKQKPVIEPYTPLATAQLWIGSTEHLEPQVRQFLKQRLCRHQSCGQCIHCRNIDAHQHHSIRWFAPANGWYKREDIDDLFATISLSMEENQEFFFIIQQADCLPSACYNSLLKSIEEPPQGYYFILLAERLHDVAATIRSRCHIKSYNGVTSEKKEEHLLAALFFANSTPTPLVFLQALEQTQPNEQQTIELVDLLLAHWLQEYRQAISKQNKHHAQRAESIINLLKDALEEPPMPGSSPLFWKQLFLHHHSHDSRQ